MHWIDWSIVGALVLALLVILAVCQRYVKSTADFLAANRCAGRYLLTITSSIAGLGAISVIAKFEQYYVSGFALEWWGFITTPIMLVISIVGWVYYRFRETRCLTMAQFFEVRYSRNFRIFSGFLGWLSGVLNYGIFPSVSVKFFIFFCGLPATFRIPGISFEFSTYVCMLALAIGLGVLFAICGGQLAIMLTDFLQGTFCNIAFLVLMVFLIQRFDWDTIFAALSDHAAANPGQSLFNPYAATEIKDFNIYYFLIGIALTFLNFGTWQGGAGYNASAKSAHEAKMARFLGTWRGMTETSLLVFIPICAFVFFHSPKFAEEAATVQAVLNNLSGQDVSQARVPLFLTHVLPVGLVGIFAAVMFAAMLSTDDTYMHSWGSILVQDVIMPFRKKPFSPQQHLRALRLSIVFVGAFAFCFSYLFKQTEYILLFFSITGAIFTGGAGAVLVGGLYSRCGSTAGAWTAMILGSCLALGSIALQQCWGILAPMLADSGHFSAAFSEYLRSHSDRFPINSQYLAISITLTGFASYFLVSMIERRIRGGELFNLDRMLHRGQYDTTGEHQERWSAGKVWRLLGLTNEFSRFDRVIFFATFGWTLLLLIGFLAGTAGEFLLHWESRHWLVMWKLFVMIGFFIGAGTTLWFLLGGIRDVFRLFKALSSQQRNMEDDGRVVDGKNAGEK